MENELLEMALDTSSGAFLINMCEREVVYSSRNVIGPQVQTLREVYDKLAMDEGFNSAYYYSSDC
jgi:hypothetical protein